MPAVGGRTTAWGVRGAVWALAPVVLASVVLLGPLRAPVAGSDEGLLLVHPDSVLRGELPNRDFATVYGPLTYWLLAAVYRLLGPSLGAERLVGVGYRLAIAVALVLLLRRRVHPVAASLAGLLSLVLASVYLPLAYAYHGALACALVGLLLLTTQRAGLRLVGGLVLGSPPRSAPNWACSPWPPSPCWPAVRGGHRSRAGSLGLLPLAVHLVTAGPGSSRTSSSGGRVSTRSSGRPDRCWWPRASASSGARWPSAGPAGTCGTRHWSHSGSPGSCSSPTWCSASTSTTSCHRRVSSCRGRRAPRHPAAAPGQRPGAAGPHGVRGRALGDPGAARSARRLTPSCSTRAARSTSRRSRWSRRASCWRRSTP